MTKSRETLNDRYMVRSYRPTHEMMALTRFVGWYALEWKIKEDGLTIDDFTIKSKDGYTNPVLHWRDNDSIYVDHKP